MLEMDCYEEFRWRLCVRLDERSGATALLLADTELRCTIAAESAHMV